MRGARTGSDAKEPVANLGAVAAKEMHMSNLIGALIGAAIDRRDGDSGMVGVG